MKKLLLLLLLLTFPFPSFAVLKALSGTSTSIINNLGPSASFNTISNGLFIDPRDPKFGSNTCTGYYGIATSALGSGGSGYAVNDKFTIAAATTGANPATGHVTGVSSGVVTTYTIDTAGGAYNLQTGNTLATTAVTGSGSGLTITISTASSTGNDDTAAINAALTYATTIGIGILAPTGCWINNLTLPLNSSITGQAIAPTYGYDSNNAPTWFIWGTPAFGLNATGSANVGLYGFQVSGIASSGAFGTTACIGGTSQGGAFFGSRNFAINMAGHHCNVGLGTYNGSGSFILWTSINSDWSANQLAGIYGPLSDFVSINDTIASSQNGIWLPSSAGGLNRIIAPRIEYINNYGVRLDSGGLQTQIDEIQTDRTGLCAIYVNNSNEVTINGGTLKGAGLSGTLSVTGAANNGSGLIRLTVSGFGNNPNGGGTATSGLSTGDVVNITGVTGTTEANGNQQVITVIDGTHIDLQSSTFVNAYSSGGNISVDGKGSYLCLASSTDVHAENVGFYGYSAGTHISAANIIDATGSSNISINGGVANIGNGNTGSYQQAFSNWHNSGNTPPSNTTFNVTGQPYTSNDNSFSINNGAATFGANGTVGGSVVLNGSTTGSVTIKVPAAAGTGTNFQLPSTNGTNTYLLQTDGSGNTSWAAPSGGVTWPTTGNIVVSNSTNTPGGLVPVNGDCVVGTGGAWVAGSCSGSASTNLGTSISATGPQRTGEATTGFYSGASGEIDGAVVTTGQIFQWTASGLNLVAGDYQISGTTALNFNSADSGTAGSSIAIGPGSLSGQTSSAAYNNTGVGYQALHGTMTTGAIDNTAVGYKAGTALTTGNKNVFVGTNAGLSDTGGSSDIYIGYQAGNGATGNSNIVLGESAYFHSGNSGSYAVVIGQSAMGSYACSFCNSFDVGIGYNVGASLTTGTSNVMIGPSVASSTLTTGSNNILIGTSSATTTPAAGSSNEINLGGLIFYNTVSLAAPVVSACGTSPSIDGNANNRSGTVTVGTVAAASCTVTFAGGGYTTWNHCRVTSQTTLAAFGYTYTKTAITVTGTSLVGDLFDYDCDGY